MFVARTGLTSRIVATGYNRRKGSIRHQRYKQAAKQYRCWIPFMPGPCIAGFAGVIVICAGVAMCTIGYYAEYFSTTLRLNTTLAWNDTDIWLGRNSTGRPNWRVTNHKDISNSRYDTTDTRFDSNVTDRQIRIESDYTGVGVEGTRSTVETWIDSNLTVTWKDVDEVQKFHLHLLTYGGPMIMAIGCFMIVVSCVLVCEHRDHIIKERVEEKEQALRLGIYKAPAKRKSLMEKVVYRLKQITNDCTGTPHKRVRVIKASKTLEQSGPQSGGLGSGTEKTDSSSTLCSRGVYRAAMSSDAAMSYAPASDHSEASSAPGTSERSSCRVIIHRQRESVSSANDEDAAAHLLIDELTDDASGEDALFYQQIPSQVSQCREYDFDTNELVSEFCCDDTVRTDESTDQQNLDTFYHMKNERARDLEQATGDLICLEAVPYDPCRTGKRNVSFVLDSEHVELNHNVKLLEEPDQYVIFHAPVTSCGCVGEQAESPLQPLCGYDDDGKCDELDPNSSHDRLLTSDIESPN